MKKILFIALMGSLLFSCSQDENIVLSDSSPHSEMGISVLDKSISTVNNFEDLHNSSDRSLKASLLPYTKVGYTNVTQSKSCKGYFSEEFAKSVGLLSGVIYVYQWKFVDIEIDTGGKVLFEEQSNNCGMKPMMSDNEEITDFSIRGYRIMKSGNSTILRTHIFYIQSELSGRKIDRYVPRIPEKLEWVYYLF